MDKDFFLTSKTGQIVELATFCRIDPIYIYISIYLYIYLYIYIYIYIFSIVSEKSVLKKYKLKKINV